MAFRHTEFILCHKPEERLAFGNGYEMPKGY